MLRGLLSKFLELKFRNRVLFGRNFAIPAPPVFCFALTLGIGILFACTVQLKPEIGPNFFFSSDDPQMQDEKKIQTLFPQDPQLVFSVKGDIHSEKYLERIDKLSSDLMDLEKVISVQSLTAGPGSLERAKTGPLWKRILISEDGESSLLVAFIEDIDPEVFVPKIEAVIQKNEEPDFQILVSGEPYIIELLRRSLFEDLKKFSVVAFIVFGCLFLFFFRSLQILIGTLLSCATASMVTLIVSQQIGVETGPLTANLSTIVFVLTLSHLIFIIFNWREAIKKNKDSDEHPSIKALEMTLYASFWSMLTTFLGFLSLLLVKATPLRQLGAAGAIGTVTAFIVAYVFFPLFLYKKDAKVKKLKHEEHEKKMEPFFYRKHKMFFTLLTLCTSLTAIGVFYLNTDPSLIAYFKSGSDLREGLEYIDKNGGSSPLSMVVHDPAGSAFHEKEGYGKLWDATVALEDDPEVGSAVSLPIVIAQAEKNLIAKILTVEWLIDLLESKRFGRVAKYFVTQDRSKALIMLRMREEGREGLRVEILDRLTSIVKKNGLFPFLTGGVYSLQGRMSQLIKSSLFSGLSLLLLLFVMMGWLISRSLKIALAMFFSMLMVPVTILGMLGIFRIPLDVISAPAANIAIGMGVDAMIHMLIYVRRNHKKEMTLWNSWRNAVMRFWRPVLYTAIIIGAGFGIFGLSDFPPTQRFGLMVVTGAFMAPCAALIAFVTLASSKLKFSFPFLVEIK